MISRRCIILAFIAFVTVPLASSAHAQYLPLSGVILSSWHLDVVDEPGDVGQFSSLALDSIDQPHVSCYDVTNGDLRYAHFDGAVWQVNTIDSGNDVGYSGALALDSNGWPHIAYCRLYVTPHGAPCDELRHAYYDGATWHIETVVTWGEAGPSISLALDSNDHPHISYCLLSLGGGWPRPTFSCDALRYAYHDGASWHIETVESAGRVGGHTSLAIDSAGRPHVSYAYYNASGGDLRHAWHDGSAWITETVDSAGDVGSCSSLAMDAANRPQISYYDGSNDDLEYACYDGSSWRFQRLDNGGLHISLGLDAAAYPHISYQGYGGLKYAHAVAPCAPVGEATFSWRPFTPTVGVMVTFTASATGTAPISYSWNPGDGPFVLGPSSITHAYSTAGVYTVTLSATNPCGRQVVRHALAVAALPSLEWNTYLPLLLKR